LNDKKAKKLRRLIFGDRAYRNTKEYVAVRYERKAKLVDLPGGLVLDVTPFTVMLKPETVHSYYRAMKRAYESNH
jgi:hypothetical protein